jgi:WD40 repeat protein
LLIAPGAAKEVIRREYNDPNHQDLICKGTLNGHRGPVWDLVISVQYRCIISASSDLNLKVWDMDTFKCKKTLQVLKHMACV